MVRVDSLLKRHAFTASMGRIFSLIPHGKWLLSLYFRGVACLLAKCVHWVQVLFTHHLWVSI